MNFYKKNALRVIKNKDNLQAFLDVDKSDKEKEKDVVELFILTLDYFRNFNRIKSYEAPIIYNPSEKQLLMLWKWFDEMLIVGMKEVKTEYWSWKCSL